MFESHSDGDICRLMATRAKYTPMKIPMEGTDFLTPRDQPGPSSNERKPPALVDVYLRNLHEELVGELYQQFKAMYFYMFDPVLVRNGVAQFFDTVIVDRIQTKGIRLLNESIPVCFWSSKWDKGRN